MIYRKNFCLKLRKDPLVKIVTVIFILLVLSNIKNPKYPEQWWFTNITNIITRVKHQKSNDLNRYQLNPFTNNYHYNKYLRYWVDNRLNNSIYKKKGSTTERSIIEFCVTIQVSNTHKKNPPDTHVTTTLIFVMRLPLRLSSPELTRTLLPCMDLKRRNCKLCDGSVVLRHSS